MKRFIFVITVLFLLACTTFANAEPQQRHGNPVHPGIHQPYPHPPTPYYQYRPHPYVYPPIYIHPYPYYGGYNYYPYYYPYYRGLYFNFQIR